MPMPAIPEVRSQFPFLAECAYLDTASTGLTPPGVSAAVTHYLDVVKARGILGRDAWRARGKALRARLATMLGVVPTDLAFLSNTSEGINLFAHSLDWRRGDQVVVAADEYPTVRDAWRFATRRGVEIVPVPIHDEARREDLLLNAISVRTRVVAVSHVHWVSGTRLDIDRIGRHCRGLDALLVVDGIQALGAVPVDLRHVDVYSAATFKWLLAGFGFAIMATSERARAAIEPVFRGAMNTPHQLTYSHTNYAGVYALDATLDYLDSVGWDAIHARVKYLAGRLHAELEGRGHKLCAPADRIAGIVSIPVHDDFKHLEERMAERGIRITVRSPVIRISPHFYNDDSDIDRVVDALHTLLVRNTLKGLS
jgi:cysteine desulfurase/selenocysteine lyase